MTEERNDCALCLGTGEGQNNYSRCAACKGRGWLAPKPEVDEPLEEEVYQWDES